MSARLGAWALNIAEDVGGVTLVLGRSAQAAGRGRIDRAELLRSLYHFGVTSLPIVIATAAFTGMIMVLQGAAYVRLYGVYDLVGWYTGFSTFREVGPVLIGLMFSGRVGASNTSELATMRVTEQLDALRVLALDPYEIIIVPRAVAMVVSMFALVCLGDLVAVLGGALAANVLLDVDSAQFLTSLSTRVTVGDFVLGLEKALVFGLAIAMVSTYFGLSAKGGSTGVGRAVNAQVVGCALSLSLADYLLSSVLR